MSQLVASAVLCSSTKKLHRKWKAIKNPIQIRYLWSNKTAGTAGVVLTQKYRYRESADK